VPPFDPYHQWLGIPSSDQPPHHYRLLGLQLFESDPDVISAAADRQMAFIKECATGPHAAASQKLLNELSAARVCLSDGVGRVTFDVELSNRPHLVRIDFKEKGGAAAFALGWSKPESFPEETIPPAAWFHDPLSAKDYGAFAR